MKIDSDLRIAIRAAEKAQPHENWDLKQARNKAAVAALIAAKPAVAAGLKSAQRRLTQIKKLNAKVQEFLNLAGLRLYGDEPVTIGDEAAFVKAGGKLPGQGSKRWKFDAVMAELANANEKQGEAILKRIGINWK